MERNVRLLVEESWHQLLRLRQHKQNDDLSSEVTIEDFDNILTSHFALTTDGISPQQEDQKTDIGYAQPLLLRWLNEDIMK